MFQLRIRSAPKEKQQALDWASMMSPKEAKKGRPPASTGLSMLLEKAVLEAFPGDLESFRIDEKYPERHLPSPGANRKEALKLAEHVLCRGRKVLLDWDERFLPAEHQTTRMLLQATLDTLFPSCMRTHRSDVMLEATVCALKMVNELYYLIRCPSSERARVSFLLLPHAERRALASTKGRRSKKWREAVDRII